MGLRNYVSEAIVALVAGGLVLGGLGERAGAETPHYRSNISQVPYSRFVSAIGYRFNGLGIEKRDSLEREWKSSRDEIGKREIVNIYRDPVGCLNSLGGEDRSSFEAFSVGDLDPNELEDYKSQLPIVNGKLTLADKIILWELSQIVFPF